MSGIFRNFVLMITDALCIGGCWVAVVLGYHGIFGAHYQFGVEFYWRMWPVVPAFVTLNALFRLYHGRVLYPAMQYSPVEEMRRLFGSVLLVHLGAIAIIVMMRQTMLDYSRVVVIFSGLFTAALAQSARDLARVLMKRYGFGQIKVLVVGSDAATSRICEVLNASAYLGMKPVKAVSDLREVIREGRDRGVKTLIACQDERFLRAQLRELSAWFRYIEYVPKSATFPVYGSRTVSFDGIGGIEMVSQGVMRLVRVEKWVLDKMLAALAFLLFSPFFAILPILIKFTSSGPVFYRQLRLGQYGHEIRVWKFRSMYADADRRLEELLESDEGIRCEWEKNFKLKKDPRVTPLGRFLRATSLDELPQLFNVFAGDMALVGPRPIVSGEVGYYGDSYDVFASVKPGITGLWQASGRSDTSYPRRVALDVEYVLNWSPWLDIWILFRTVVAVLMMRGAR